MIFGNSWVFKLDSLIYEQGLQSHANFGALLKSWALHETVYIWFSFTFDLCLLQQHRFELAKRKHVRSFALNRASPDKLGS